MGARDLERMQQIKRHLKQNPRGLTISDAASKMQMNRNLVAKYLDMLLISGQVEMQEIGAAKVYFLSHRVPIASMLDLSSDMVIILDDEQEVVWVNKSMLVALNEDRESVVGTEMTTSTNPLFLALVQHLPPPGSCEAPEQIVKVHCVLAEKESHFRVKRMPVVFEDGGRGITLTLEDITGETAYQERLRASEARYRGIVEDQTEFIVRCAPDGTATFVNGAYARYLGEHATDLLGSPFIPAIDAGDTLARDRAFRSLKQDHPVATFECRVHHPSGDLRWNVWAVRAFFDGPGHVTECQAVGQDITEKREAAARINDHIRGMEFLSQTCVAFMDMEEDEDIYGYVVRQASLLAPVPLVWISTITDAGQNLVLKSVAGDPAVLEILEQFPEIRSPFPVAMADTAELLQRRRLVRVPSLSRSLYAKIPEEAHRQIVAITGDLDTCVMGLVSRGRLVGKVGMCQKSGSLLSNQDLIEALIRQAAIAIDRRIAVETLKASLAREREQVQNLQFLSRTAMAFTEMEGSADIYRYIADRLAELVPESLIGIFSFDPGEKELMLRAVAGNEEQIARFWEALGIASPLGLSFPIDELPRSENDLGKGTLFEVSSVYDSLLHQVSQERCARVEQELKIGRGFSMGFTCKDRIFGSVLIGLFRADDIVNRELVEAFVNQASVALLRRCARTRHRESEDLFRLFMEQMPYPVVILGRDGCILDANASAATLVGCHAAAGLIGRSFYEYVVGGSSRLPGLLRSLASGGGGNRTSRLCLRSCDSGTCDVEARGRMARYNMKPALYLCLRPFPSGSGVSVRPQYGTAPDHGR